MRGSEEIVIVVVVSVALVTDEDQRSSAFGIGDEIVGVRVSATLAAHWLSTLPSPWPTSH